MLELFNGKSNHSIQVWVRKVFRCLLLHCRTARGHWTQECRMSDRLSSLSTPRSSGKIFSRQENKQRWSGHSAVCEPGQSHRWAGGPLPFSSPPTLPGQQTLIMTGGREGEVERCPIARANIKLETESYVESKRRHGSNTGHCGLVTVSTIIIKYSSWRLISQ